MRKLGAGGVPSACVCRVLSPCRGRERVVRQSESSQGQGQRANQDFFSGVVSFGFFFRGAWPVLLQEFDWLGSSNRQQKIGSSPEKTKPLQVLATLRWNILPRLARLFGRWLRRWPLLISSSPLIAVAAGAGPGASRAGLTGKLGEVGADCNPSCLY